MSNLELAIDHKQMFLDVPGRSSYLKGFVALFV